MRGSLLLGNPSQGVCSAGGAHDGGQSGHYAALVGDAIPGTQNGWRWCQKCQGMFFSGNPDQGHCPAGGTHDSSASWNYAINFGDQVPGEQGQWRWCQKCQGSFFSGNPDQGRCPAGGGHDASGSASYSVPWETGRLNSIPRHTGPIVFDNGVPVGGWAYLTVNPDGSYRFQGHFHDFGSTSYTVGLVWILNSSTGTAFTFATQGSVHGTFDFVLQRLLLDNQGVNPALADAWDDLSAGCAQQWSAQANIDLGGNF